jgi:hypothetical protein
MKNPINATSPPSSPAAVRTGPWGGAIPSIGAPRAYSAIVFVGAWNASGVRVPSTREQHDTAGRCAGCP